MCQLYKLFLSSSVGSHTPRPQEGQGAGKKVHSANAPSTRKPRPRSAPSTPTETPASNYEIPNECARREWRCGDVRPTLNLGPKPRRATQSGNCCTGQRQRRVRADTPWCPRPDPFRLLYRGTGAGSARHGRAVRGFGSHLGTSYILCSNF